MVILNKMWKTKETHNRDLPDIPNITAVANSICHDQVYLLGGFDKKIKSNTKKFKFLTMSWFSGEKVIGNLLNQPKGQVNLFSILM